MAARRLSTGEHDTDLERPGRGGLGRRHQRRRGLAEEVGEELGDLICDRSIESDELDGKAHARPEIRRYGQRGTVGRTGHSPGLPAAELAGPSTTEKLERRTEGSGSACRSRFVCTSLYTEASRPGAGPPFAATAPPLDVTAAAAMRPSGFGRAERSVFR